MRISKDKNSWSAGGIIKRDARQDKSFEKARGPGGKKNTKKWCKGIEGRLHVPGWHPTRWQHGRPKGQELMQVSCDNCGKIFDIAAIPTPPKKGREVLLAKWRAKLGIK